MGAISGRHLGARVRGTKISRYYRVTYLTLVLKYLDILVPKVRYVTLGTVSGRRPRHVGGIALDILVPKVSYILVSKVRYFTL